MIQYNEDYLVNVIFRWRGSVAQRASLFAFPTAGIAILLLYVDEWMPGFRADVGLAELGSSQLWAVSTSVLAILLGFRTNRAMARFWEGTGLLHQMRGEWFDSISCCVTFSRAALPTRYEEVHDFRHTIVRLMSLCHASALEEIALSPNSGELETIDSFGLNSRTLQHLKDCKQIHHFNTVEVLLHLIQSLITCNQENNILKIPPPILSRVYQTLSRGFVNLLNAKKIADTRFPFPYAQLIAILLIINIFLTPMMVTCLVSSKVLAAIFSFVPIFGMYSLNFIGVELENPFGNDDNDLPLDHFQTEMNKCLLMLLEDNADLIAGVSETRCIRDFKKLKGAMRPTHHQGEVDDHGRLMEKKATYRLSQYEQVIRDEYDTSGMGGISSMIIPDDAELPAHLRSHSSHRSDVPVQAQNSIATTAPPKRSVGPETQQSPQANEEPKVQESKAPIAANLMQNSPLPDPPPEGNKPLVVAEREPSTGPPPSILIEPKMVMGASDDDAKLLLEPKLGSAPYQYIRESLKECNQALVDMEDYDRGLQQLKELSVVALKEFSDAISALPHPKPARLQTTRHRLQQLQDNSPNDKIDLHFPGTHNGPHDDLLQGAHFERSHAGPRDTRPAASPPLPAVTDRKSVV